MSRSNLIFFYICTSLFLSLSFSFSFSLSHRTHYKSIPLPTSNKVNEVSDISSITDTQHTSEQPVAPTKIQIPPPRPPRRASLAARMQDEMSLSFQQSDEED